MKKRKKKKENYNDSPNHNPPTHSNTPELFMPADKEHIKKERQKAKDLKKTNWWRNKLDKGQCYYCGKKFQKEELSMDHLTPLVRWGKTIKNNVVPACKTCNHEKKHKTLVDIRLR